MKSCIKCDPLCCSCWGPQLKGSASGWQFAPQRPTTCGVVWCGVVWCGVVWCGVVWCGVVWCGVVWCGVVWCGVVWCGVVWCGVVWCGVVWCGVVWCGVVWCGVVWCGVVWCGVVWCGVVWCGVVWCGVWCGVVWCAEGAVTRRQWPGCLPTGTGKRAGLCVLCARRVYVCRPRWREGESGRPGRLALGDRAYSRSSRCTPSRSACWCRRSSCNAHAIVLPGPRRASSSVARALAWAYQTRMDSSMTWRRNSVPSAWGPVHSRWASYMEGVRRAAAHCSSTAGSHSWWRTGAARGPTFWSSHAASRRRAGPHSCD